MNRRVAAALIGFAFICGATVAQPPRPPEISVKNQEKKDTPKKDAPKKDAPKKDGGKDAPKKEAKPKPPTPGKEVTGMFKTKDVSKKTFTLVIDGKDKTYKINNDTKFSGPRGGTSDDGLKDDRLDKGFKIAVIPDAADDTVALEVKLPFRNQREEGKAGEKKRGLR